MASLFRKLLNKKEQEYETSDSELVYMTESDSVESSLEDSKDVSTDVSKKGTEKNSENPSDDISENKSEETTNKDDKTDSIEDEEDPVQVTKNLTIYSGNTDRIKIIAGDEKPENISYTSQDTTIAEVVLGHVIAKREGETTVTTTFSLNGEEMSFTTTVTVLAGKVSVSASEVSVMVGTATRIRTKVNKGVLSAVIYESSNPEVATVVNDGVDGIITGISPGDATIKATADVSGSITTKEVAVTVSPFDVSVIPIHNPVNASKFTELDDWQGSRVYFGAFEQDNKTSNGKEPILWRVLEVTENSALLLSEYGLICKNIHETFESFTWETCSLRKWLNTTFLDVAFTNQERKAILDSHITTPDSSYWGTKGGNDTVDKVFLLCMQEAMNPAYGFPNHIKESKTRELKCSTYARLHDGYMNKTNGNTCWWLRSPGLHDNYAAYVFSTGAITASYFVGRRYDAIRPAIRVDLTAVHIKLPKEGGDQVYPHINVREY